MSDSDLLRKSYGASGYEKKKLPGVKKYVVCWKSPGESSCRWFWNTFEAIWSICIIDVLSAWFECDLWNLCSHCGPSSQSLI